MDGCSTRPPRARLVWSLVQLVAAVLVITTGAALGAVGWLGWLGRLRRNRLLGVRTAATLASEDAFRLGNKAAAPLLMAAAAVAVLGAVAALRTPSVPAYSVVLAMAVFGMLALAATAGVLGSRAAATGMATGMATGGGREFPSCAGCACSGGPGTGGCSALTRLAPE